MKYAFAGDRQLSCEILNFLMMKGFVPLALLVTDGKGSSHANELIKLSGLEESSIFVGKEIIKNKDTLQFLTSLNLDYIIGIHYPYIISNELLNIPKVGFLNLHPAYLPYNKGWNTPSWAIIDNSDYGATLHFMSEKLDEGDIVHQKRLIVNIDETANELYYRVLKTEKEVFIEAFDEILSLQPKRISQNSIGTMYKKADLQKIRSFDLNETIIVKDFLNKLRALTTNNYNELAYFVDEGKKIGVKVEFVQLDE